MNLHTYKQIRRIEVMKANRAKSQNGVNLHLRSVQLQERMSNNQEAILRQSEQLGLAQNAELTRIADALDRIQAPVTAADL